MTRLEYSGRKQRNEGNPRQDVDYRNIINMNLLVPRERSRPNQVCQEYYKYRAPVSHLTHFSKLQRAVFAHCSPTVLCANPGEGVAPVLGWDYLISLVSIFAWCISLAWLLIATSILLCQGQGARRVASANGWVTRVLSMVKQAQSFIF